ncbi:MAG: hypothetical protein KAW09_11065 [Thermoplasmata archaeon]|nr:hypothetical protein [Thermoplasmata archaeon]
MLSFIIKYEESHIHIAGSGSIPPLQKTTSSSKSEKEDAKYFTFEEDRMYTKRESELIQQFLQNKGSMPRYNDELDDLF